MKALSLAQTIQALFEGALALLAIIGNLTIIVLILTTKKLQTSTNYLIVNLCLPGLVVGAAVLPLQVVADFDIYPEYPMICISAHTMIIIFDSWMIFGLVVVVADRQLAIFQPFSYEVYFTTRNVTVVSVVVVVVSLLTGVYPMVYQMYEYRVIPSCSFHHAIPYTYGMTMLIVYISCLVGIAVAYGRIILVVRKQIRQIASLTVTVDHSIATDQITRGGVTTTGYHGNEITNQPEQYKHTKHLYRKEVKATLVLLGTIAFFFVSSLPIMTCLVLLYNDVHPGRAVLISAIALSFLFHVLNPFIFGFGYKRFRDHLREALRCGR